MGCAREDNCGISIREALLLPLATGEDSGHVKNYSLRHKSHALMSSSVGIFGSLIYGANLFKKLIYAVEDILKQKLYLQFVL